MQALVEFAQKVMMEGMEAAQMAVAALSRAQDRHPSMTRLWP